MPAYSGKAQPYLNAIADGVFASQAVRDWLIKGTPIEPDYIGSSVLIDEQRAVRWQIKPTKQPFGPVRRKPLGEVVYKNRWGEAYPGL